MFQNEYKSIYCSTNKHSHISGQLWLRRFHSPPLWSRWRPSEAASRCPPAEWPCKLPHSHLNRRRKRFTLETWPNALWSTVCRRTLVSRSCLQVLVVTYQHRDSSEPARSYPIIGLVSRAPARAARVYPKPWLRLSPVNGIWVWVFYRIDK